MAPNQRLFKTLPKNFGNLRKGRSTHWLRGANTVFLASPASFAAELVLDGEQLQRGSAIVQTLSPLSFSK
jgi:hypothetical protein